MTDYSNHFDPETLIQGFLTGKITNEEKDQLILWISENPENRKQFDQYCELWVTARSGVRHPEYNYHEGFWKFKHRIESETQLPHKESRLLIYRDLMKYAAILVLAAGISGVFFFQYGKKNALASGNNIQELTVPRGSNARFTLSDGSVVTLNAGSKLVFGNDYGVSERVVALEGEGYFSVAKDPKRPFTVRTSHINITALGTSFNVKAYSEDNKIETTLVEGSVRIEGIARNSEKEVTILKPNERLTFFKSDSSMVDSPAAEENIDDRTDYRIAEMPKPVPVLKAVTEVVNIQPVISWKENKWIFEQQSLSQIAIELERKYDVMIEFRSERLKAYRFTGTVLAEPIEQVLEWMSISAPIKYELDGRVVTLSENKDFEKLNKLLYNQK